MSGHTFAALLRGGTPSVPVKHTRNYECRHTRHLDGLHRMPVFSLERYVVNADRAGHRHGRHDAMLIQAIRRHLEPHVQGAERRRQLDRDSACGLYPMVTAGYRPVLFLATDTGPPAAARLAPNTRPHLLSTYNAHATIQEAGELTADEALDSFGLR